MNSRTKTLTADFICAPATATGARQAIAVIRASGAPSGKETLFTALGGAFQTLTGKRATDLSPRVAYYGLLRDGDEVIDDVLFTRYSGRASFTGEDSFEISCHGNPLIVKRILALLYARGFRAAEPGEFTRRAYLNGKLGLDAAQAVAEIIDARSALTLKAAQRLAQGSFRRELLQLRSQLMNLGADLNAELDFIDEDISFATRDTKLTILRDTEAAARRLENEAARFDSLKSGVHIAIVGAPNAGKSSLMNRLVGQDRSIVSDIAGTTRDYIEAEIEIAGANIRLFDTAGLRETAGDSIEQIGIERTRELMSRAHIILLLIDGSAARRGEPTTDAEGSLTGQRVTVINKRDVLHESWRAVTGDQVLISARTGEGLDTLIERVGSLIAGMAPKDALPLSVWQRQLLNEIADILLSASQAVEAGELPEVITHLVGSALNKIAELTGDITSEDILGRIFSRFCIGK